MPKYNRTLAELQSRAVLHWPEEILKAAGDLSVLPLLLTTQDAFISLLKIADKSPTAWIIALNQSSTLSGSLFLKHLMIASDLGGETLNKLPPLSQYYPDRVLKFYWKNQICEYQFQVIHKKCSLNNSSLKVDAKNLLTGGELTAKMQDVAMLLLFGFSTVNDSLPLEIKDRCILGTFLGRSEELDRFAKENYIRVSRQVGGATANALGQFAQNYVVQYLRAFLPPDWIISRDSSLPNVSHTTEGKGTNFDIVVKSPRGNYVGIEVSFQVTTNSVIERKARESESLMSSVHSAGHKICYVIDGAGNINIRKKATSILCENSDCTVAMSTEEIKYLANFLVESDSDSIIND